jgi:nicotinamide phosphoribosyltransferase
MHPLDTDSYHETQHLQHPPGLTNMFSHGLARGGEYREVVPFGMQYLLLKYFSKPTTLAEVSEAHAMLKLHFGKDLFNLAGWMHIVQDHGGHLPLHIKAVLEGTPVPVGNVLFTAESTCPQCAWVVEHCETLLILGNWYPTAVATKSRETKKVILRYLEQTGDPTLIDFKLHDFGFRGASSVETAGIGGLAHLVNFLGTDTLKALQVGRDYYGSPCAGFSIPASQHSSIGSWGRDGERDAFRNMLQQFPDGLVACVSDTYNIWDACEKLWGEDLKAEVLARSGTLVVRPDSGKPIRVILDKVVRILDSKFGSTQNMKGYKVLDPHVRVIQGDGVNMDSIDECLWILQQSGYSADNVAFGEGSGLLQEHKRDDLKYKFAGSSVVVNGEERDVYKDPITDQGKKSQRGRVTLIHDGEKYKTVREHEANGRERLYTKFKDGCTSFESLDEIRQRASVPAQRVLPLAS